MNDFTLPIELRELEREWADRHEGLDASFEAKLIAQIRRTLQAQRKARGRVFALVAAGVLLSGLHVSWHASQHVPSTTIDPIDQAQLEVGTAGMLALAPELSPTEAELHARLMLLRVEGGSRITLPPPLSSRSSLD